MGGKYPQCIGEPFLVRKYWRMSVCVVNIAQAHRQGEQSSLNGFLELLVSLPRDEWCTLLGNGPCQILIDCWGAGTDVNDSDLWLVRHEEPFGE